MNENTLNKAYRQLPDNYLFSTIARKIADHQTSHPGADIIRLTAFGDPEQTEIALKRIQNNLKKLRF